MSGANRFESSVNEAGAALPDVCMFLAFDLDFQSGHLRSTDDIGSVTIGGYTYAGNGQVQLADKIEEGVDVVAKPIKLLISGVDSSLVAAVRAGDYQDRAVSVYLGLRNRETLALIDTPEVWWEGRMDVATIRLGQGEASIIMNCEHRLRREPRIARNTDADQQLRYPGDRFFDRVMKVPGTPGKWGEKNGVNPVTGYYRRNDPTA